MPTATHTGALLRLLLRLVVAVGLALLAVGVGAAWFYDQPFTAGVDAGLHAPAVLGWAALFVVLPHVRRWREVHYPKPEGDEGGEGGGRWTYRLQVGPLAMGAITLVVFSLGIAVLVLVSMLIVAALGWAAFDLTPAAAWSVAVHHAWLAPVFGWLFCSGSPISITFRR